MAQKFCWFYVLCYIKINWTCWTNSIHIVKLVFVCLFQEQKVTYPRIATANSNPSLTSLSLVLSLCSEYSCSWCSQCQQGVNSHQKPDILKKTIWTFYLMKVGNVNLRWKRGRCTPSPFYFTLFALYSNYLQATHTWKFLTFFNFWLRIPL